jgi:hypothetical protein
MLVFVDTGGILSIPSRSGEYDGSLSFVKSLSCEDFWAESDELYEYADNRLDMDDIRFISFGLVLAPGPAGGVISCPTGFRVIDPAGARGRGASAMMGKTGKGESNPFDPRLSVDVVLMSELFFFGGSGVGGKDGRSRNAVAGRTFKSTIPGGGVGRALEKRERPVLGI